jgi:hypothetical protein
MNSGQQPTWLSLFPDHDFEFRFGARPGDAVRFFADTVDHSTLMAGRRNALEKAPAQCVFEESSAAEAVAECLAWAGLDGGGCRELALHWEPDFLILLPDENGRFIFRAGAVCFPSSWRPEEKIGLPVHVIHSPVPSLNENLGARIDKFLANLEPGKAWKRSNWGLSRSPELNQHPTRDTSRLTPPFTAAEAWIRIEDQVLYRLPQSQALLFGIRLVNVSLAELKKFPEAQAGLHRAIATMPKEVADYKNVTEAREHLLVLLG